MFHEKFRIRRPKDEKKVNRSVSIASNFSLYSGVFIILSASIYMIINLEKTDAIVKLCLPFILTGVVLCYMSLIITWIYKKQNK